LTLDETLLAHARRSASVRTVSPDEKQRKSLTGFARRPLLPLPLRLQWLAA